MGAKIGEQHVHLRPLASDPAFDGFSSHLNQARHLNEVEKRGVCGYDLPILVDDHKSLWNGLDKPQNIGVVVRRRPCSLAKPRKQDDEMGSAILTVKGARQQDASLVAFELNMDIVDTRRHAGCGKEGLRNLPAALADQGLERLSDQLFWVDTQKGQRCGIRLDDLRGVRVHNQHRLGGELKQKSVALFRVPDADVLALHLLLRFGQSLLQNRHGPEIPADSEKPPVRPKPANPVAHRDVRVVRWSGD